MDRLKPGSQRAIDVVLADSLMRAEKAANEGDVAYAEGLRLYAALVPAFHEWEDKLADTDARSSEYVEAFVTAIATLAAGVCRTSAECNQELVDKIGPLMTSLFARILHVSVLQAKEVIIDNSKNHLDA